MGARRDVDKLRLIVLHTTEGGEGGSSAEQLASFVGRPGDRLTESGGRYGSSYNFVLDTDRVIPLVPVDRVAYSAAGANHDGIHVVFPGRASQTRAQWLDPITSAYIDQCAQLIVALGLRHNIPRVRILDAEVKAGERGYCDHAVISRVYKRSNHTDLGLAFPWDVLAKRIQAIEHIPIEEDDMKTAVIWRHPAYKNSWLVGVGAADHLTPGQFDLYKKAGIPEVTEAHPQKLAQCLHQCGLSTADLVKV